MMPKSLYAIKSNKAYLGYRNVRDGSSVFGFLYLNHVAEVYNVIKNKQFVVSQIPQTTHYLLKTQRLSTPLRKASSNIIKVNKRETGELVIEAILNNMSVEIIDDVIMTEKGLIVCSNFELPDKPGPMPSDVLRMRLDALYDGKEFTIADIRAIAEIMDESALDDD